MANRLVVVVESRLEVVVKRRVVEESGQVAAVANTPVVVEESGLAVVESEQVVVENEPVVAESGQVEEMVVESILVVVES